VKHNWRNWLETGLLDEGIIMSIPEEYIPEYVPEYVVEDDLESSNPAAHNNTNMNNMNGQSLGRGILQTLVRVSTRELGSRDASVRGLSGRTNSFNSVRKNSSRLNSTEGRTGGSTRSMNPTAVGSAVGSRAGSTRSVVSEVFRNNSTRSMNPMGGGATIHPAA
jgi:hypothetical protein